MLLNKKNIHYYLFFIVLFSSCNEKAKVNSEEHIYACENANKSLMILNDFKTNKINILVEDYENTFFLNPFVKVTDIEINYLNNIRNTQNKFDSIIFILSDTSLHFKNFKNEIHGFRNKISERVGTYEDIKGQNHSFSTQNFQNENSIKEYLKNEIKNSSPSDSTIIFEIFRELTLLEDLSFDKTITERELIVNTFKSTLNDLNYKVIRHIQGGSTPVFCGFNKLYPFLISKQQVVSKPDSIHIKYASAYIDTISRTTNVYSLNFNKKEYYFEGNSITVKVEEEGLNILSGYINIIKMGAFKKVFWEYEFYVEK